DAVAARQRKHQLRLEAALDVNVQLAFGEPRDQSVGVMHAKPETIRRPGDSDSSYRSPAPESFDPGATSNHSPPPLGNPVPRYDLEHIPVVLIQQSAPTCVTRGLDPRVHHSSQEFFAKRMDCRVKPGNDGLGQADRNAL